MVTQSSISLHLARSIEIKMQYVKMLGIRNKKRRLSIMAGLKCLVMGIKPSP